MSELECLVRNDQLVVLSIEGNPVSEQLNIGDKVFKMLP